MSAFQGFCRAAVAGRFAVDDREDLWWSLVTVTARKATAELRRHYDQKRGAGVVQGESFLVPRSATASSNGHPEGIALAAESAITVAPGEEATSDGRQLTGDTRHAIEI
jgi:hypothetical protein